jgi:H+/Cl- antiporter ClcA
MAVLIAVGVIAIFNLARALLRFVENREFVMVPLAGLAVAGLAIAFAEITDHSVNDVLFSGETDLPQLVAGASTWSVGALAALLLFKGVAWTVSLSAFRGGPVFPSLYLGAAAGLAASHLAGFAMTPAVAAGMGAATTAALGLPLSGVILAVLLTANTGPGASPVIIVAVVVSFLVTRALAASRSAQPANG